MNRLFTLLLFHVLCLQTWLPSKYFSHKFNLAWSEDNHCHLKELESFRRIEHLPVYTFRFPLAKCC